MICIESLNDTFFFLFDHFELEHPGGRRCFLSVKIKKSPGWQTKSPRSDIMKSSNNDEVLVPG